MKRFLYLLLIISVVIACKKDPPVEPDPPEAYENGLLVLNEGLYQQNNATITFYDHGEGQSHQQVFFQENGRGLGDTANDFEKYTIGGKDYVIIIVDVSSQVEIVDAGTMKSVAQIPLFDGGNAREPRQVEVLGQNAYICNFDGTVTVIDLNQNKIIQTIDVGLNPDGLAIVGDKLYVSNSGGLNSPVYDSTVSVININTFQVENTIQTRINSSKMIVDYEGDIYLYSAGNYGSLGPALLRIDTDNNIVSHTFDLPIGAMDFYDNGIYYFDTEDNVIKRFNTLTETVESAVILDVSSFETLYKVVLNPVNGDIYCIDAKGYINSSVITCYSNSGNFKYKFTAGLNANNIIFN